MSERTEARMDTLNWLNETIKDLRGDINFNSERIEGLLQSIKKLELEIIGIKERIK